MTSPSAPSAPASGIRDLQPDVIEPDLRARTGRAAIQELHSRLCRCDGVTDGARFLQELFIRQTLNAHCIDGDIAFPHVRTAAVNRIVFAVGRSTAGIHFDDAHQTIKLVFLIGAPVPAITDYLRWTALLGRRLRDPKLKDALFHRADVEGVRRALSPST